jgi:RHS repeat-associated protein
LNRVIKRTYTDSTPEVDYYYDNQPLPTTKPPNFTPAYSTGRLIAVTYGGVSSSAGNYQSYDQLGRVTSSYQQTDSQNYGFGYAYNLASEMTTETYPSGRQVITEYDSAGRAAGIRSPAIYYAGARASDATNRIQYAAHGAVSVMKFDNDLWEHTLFNNRLQPTQIGLGTSGTDSSLLKLDYSYGTTTNNGNVISQTITMPTLTLNQCYGYDYLNRLTSAEEKGGGTVCAGTQQWKQAFTYDRFGNRNFNLVDTTPNVLGPNPTISQSTNRIASGQNYGYDSAGNLTSETATNSNGIVYDAENRQTQYTKTGQATNYYYYDGDGHRVKKIDITGTTVFVYDAGGQLIAEYTAANPSSGGTSYLTSDHLGSTRVVMKSDGTTTTRHDYLPFGEEIQAGIGGRTTGQGYVADSVRQKFTQKERDNESGLDYFLARYYSSAQGRFTSPDEFAGGPREFWILGSGDAQKQALAYADIANPQSLNKYQYTYSNPLRYVDPNGHGPDILVIEGGPTEGNPIGHTAIAVTGLWCF